MTTPKFDPSSLGLKKIATVAAPQLKLVVGTDYWFKATSDIYTVATPEKLNKDNSVKEPAGVMYVLDVINLDDGEQVQIALVQILHENMMELGHQINDIYNVMILPKEEGKRYHQVKCDKYRDPADEPAADEPAADEPAAKKNGKK